MKKWFITGGSFAALTSIIGLSYLKKRPKSNAAETQRKTLLAHFKKEGYTVHSHNQCSDFILFHPDQSQTQYIMVLNESISENELTQKLDAYAHFTSSLYFITENPDLKTIILNWHSNRALNITLYISSFDNVIDSAVKKPWIRLRP
ncbi:hypothetical protein IMZ31_22765 (plasmid) [Pontibacillus sp. ALD_SL1]|uniref:hypothetical protein n=1 Tax=Pontibacillus sp. ALD_SL1 TaxID=2777185 RepID=UPI001A95980F|nr:hypothetical protein [Pontibacillus sp. ALD_SL1]QST02279.1 hypothetical protein IMZ31_22765 [Pontibacillus sp. ALD_SL1]